MAEVPDWMRMIADVAAGQAALDVGLCGRCLSRPIWNDMLCFECDQWYCFNCGNDLPCPAHTDERKEER